MVNSLAALKSSTLCVLGCKHKRFSSVYVGLQARILPRAFLRFNGEPLAPVLLRRYQLLQARLNGAYWNALSQGVPASRHASKGIHLPRTSHARLTLLRGVGCACSQGSGLCRAGVCDSAPCSRSTQTCLR